MNVLFEKINKKAPKNLPEYIKTYSDSQISEIKDIISIVDDKSIPLNNLKITAPIPYPRRNIFCLGKNYTDHAKEIKKSIPSGKADVPDCPIYFTKIADPCIGHMDKV